MFNFLFATFCSLITTGGTGWMSEQDKKELAQAIKQSGNHRPATSGPAAWARHLEAMNQPQPKEWLSDNSE